ncbi:hypothetical protein [Candidatus Enterococcus clewellii]|uniref:Uncharacterized protein n=1 Tax=Candidatus Enterococcus clewellii TaxID=1834193 RepID=A0A242K255_9ENTE|nr:hypothetical protein [Enterococcus sp. 9E7_DIV0242]OTP12672.1 hypothetical protein A5888_003250 [Enterococcus sp. 9E7_DIV0242]
MTNYCSACEDLKGYAPDFMLKGITDKECKSLQNNTGLNPDLNVLHTNCEDLNDMLDCLIGGLQEDLPAYDICDLKKFIEEFINNQMIMNKALICSDCGQWTAIDQLTDALIKIINKLKEIGVWEGGLEGDFKPGMGIAGGNINLFGGSLDGNYWIKTNKNKTENDLAGGINAALLAELKESLKQELREEIMLELENSNGGE